MGYPYNVHLGPSVGRGLPGLPQRGEMTSCAVNLPTPIKHVTSGFDRLTLSPCKANTPLGESFNNGLFSIHPLRGSPGTALMARYYKGEEPSRLYQYVGFRYTPEGLEFGEPVVSETGSTSAPPGSVSLPDGSWVFAYSGDQVRRVVLDAGTLSVTQEHLYSLPESGVLASGEDYVTHASTSINVPGAGEPNLLLSADNSTLVMFQGILVDTQYWIGCFEYHLPTKQITVHKLFMPHLRTRNSSVSDLRRDMVVHRVGRWYHCAFADVYRNTTTSTTRYYTDHPVYFAVRDDFSVVTRVREYDNTITVTTSAALTGIRLFADEHSVLFVHVNDNSVSPGCHWLIALNKEGAPEAQVVGVDDHTVARVAGSDFMGTDTAVIGRNAYAGRVCCPQTGLYLKAQSQFNSYRLTDHGLARLKGLFVSHQSRINPMTNPVVDSGLVYRYRTLGRYKDNLMATFDDYVRVLMFYGDDLSQPGTEQNSVIGVIPLADGYWLGVTAPGTGTSNAHYQLFEEV